MISRNSSSVSAMTMSAPLINAFFFAANRNDTPAIEDLLAINPSLIHEKDAAGNSALHRAVINNHPDMVRFLLSKGADPAVVAENTQEENDKNLPLSLEPELEIQFNNSKQQSNGWSL